jgi:hypothetical protein
VLSSGALALQVNRLIWQIVFVPLSDRLLRAYYLVYRKADLARPKLRIFVDWLTAEMAAYKVRGVRGVDRTDMNGSSPSSWVQSPPPAVIGHRKNDIAVT